MKCLDSTKYFIATLVLLMIGLLFHLISLLNNQWIGQHEKTSVVSMLEIEGETRGLIVLPIVYIIGCCLIFIDILWVSCLVCGTRNLCVKLMVFFTLIPAGIMIGVICGFFYFILFLGYKDWLVLAFLGIFLYIVAMVLAIIGIIKSHQEKVPVSIPPVTFTTKEKPQVQIA